MKKFWHIIYIIIMRTLIFVLALALSPLWIIIGIILAFSVLFGEADELFDPDCDVIESKVKDCPDHVEKVDKLEDNTEIPSDN